jgi:hypothetical protein
MQRKSRNKVSEQKRKDTVARRAAQLAAERARRGADIGSRLRAKREQAGKERAHQIQLEHAAEEGDRDAIDALKKLKEEGKYMKFRGQFKSKELSNVKMGKRDKDSGSGGGESKQNFKQEQVQRQQATEATKPAKPPSPPVPQAASDTHSPAPAPQQRKRSQQQQQQQKKESFARQRQPQRPSMPSRGSAAAEAASRRAAQTKPPSTKPAKLRQEVHASRQQKQTRPSSREQAQQVGKAPVSREERARVAAARRQALERVKSRKTPSSNSKENAAPLSRGQVSWSKPKDQGTKRGDPYGGSGLSDASRKYRAKKAGGNGGVGNDMDAASAVYKARKRAKERKRGKSKPLSAAYAEPGSMAWKAQKAKEKAKGKAAFGSGAGSVADELNEVVFGKNKVKRKIYTADGKTKEMSKKRVPGAALKKSTRSPASGKAARVSPRAMSNAHADMGRGGKKLGGSKVKQVAMDPREARLKALAARGLM